MELAKATAMSKGMMNLALIELLSDELHVLFAYHVTSSTYVVDENGDVKDEYRHVLKDMASLSLVNKRFRRVYQRELFQYNAWVYAERREVSVKRFPETKYPSACLVVSRESCISEEYDDARYDPARDAMTWAIFWDCQVIFDAALKLAGSMCHTDHLDLAIRLKRDHFAVRLEVLPAVQRSLRRLNNMVRTGIEENGQKDGSRHDGGVCLSYRHPAFARVARGDAAGALALLGSVPLSPYFGNTYARDMTLVGLAFREGQYHCIGTLMAAAEEAGDGGCHEERMMNMVWAALFNTHWDGPLALTLVAELGRVFPELYHPGKMLESAARAGNGYMFEYFVQEMLRLRNQREMQWLPAPMQEEWCENLLEGAVEGTNKYIVLRVLGMYWEPTKYGFVRPRHTQMELSNFVETYYELESMEALREENGFWDTGMYEEVMKVRDSLLLNMDVMLPGARSPLVSAHRQMATAMVQMFSSIGNGLTGLTLFMLEKDAVIKEDLDLADAAFQCRRAALSQLGVFPVRFPADVWPSTWF